MYCCAAWFGQLRACIRSLEYRHSFYHSQNQPSHYEQSCSADGRLIIPMYILDIYPQAFGFLFSLQSVFYYWNLRRAKDFYRDICRFNFKCMAMWGWRDLECGMGSFYREKKRYKKSVKAYFFLFPPLHTHFFLRSVCVDIKKDIFKWKGNEMCHVHFFLILHIFVPFAYWML